MTSSLYLYLLLSGKVALGIAGRRSAWLDIEIASLQRLGDDEEEKGTNPAHSSNRERVLVIFPSIASSRVPAQLLGFLKDNVPILN